MEPLQLRDEAVRDRIRFAEEFLDPSKPPSIIIWNLSDVFKAIQELEGLYRASHDVWTSVDSVLAIAPISYSCSIAAFGD